MALDFYWIIPHQLAGASYPYTELEAFHAAGFRAIVSLVPVPEPAEVLAERLGFQVLEVPISLFGWPDDDQAREIMEFIDECVKKRQPVVVHCLQGNGRTGAVLGQYLVWTGLSAQESLERVYHARDTAFDVEEQVQAVIHFEALLKNQPR